MGHDLRYYPPVSTPDAIRSNRGWLHPLTKELLVAIEILDIPTEASMSEPTNETLVAKPNPTNKRK